jgi:hypothetical protein
MADYNKYTAQVGITNRQMITELRKYYPRYGKPTQSMVCAPKKYGVQLTPEAEAILKLKFGNAEGLSGVEWDGKTELPNPVKQRVERRSKANKLCVRLDDSLWSQFKEIYERSAFASMQDFIEAAIVEFIRRRESNVGR